MYFIHQRKLLPGPAVMARVCSQPLSVLQRYPLHSLRNEVSLAASAVRRRYGLIDRIVQPQDAVAIEEKNYEAQLAQAQAQQRGSRTQRAPEGAEAGY